MDQSIEAVHPFRTFDIQARSHSMGNDDVR